MYLISTHDGPPTVLDQYAARDPHASSRARKCAQSGAPCRGPRSSAESERRSLRGGESLAVSVLGVHTSHNTVECELSFTEKTRGTPRARPFQFPVGRFRPSSRTSQATLARCGAARSRDGHILHTRVSVLVSEYTPRLGVPYSAGESRQAAPVSPPPPPQTPRDSCQLSVELEAGAPARPLFLFCAPPRRFPLHPPTSRTRHDEGRGGGGGECESEAASAAAAPVSLSGFACASARQW